MYRLPPVDRRPRRYYCGGIYAGIAPSRGHRRRARRFCRNQPPASPIPGRRCFGRRTAATSRSSKAVRRQPGRFFRQQLIIPRCIFRQPGYPPACRGDQPRATAPSARNTFHRPQSERRRHRSASGGFDRIRGTGFRSSAALRYAGGHCVGSDECSQPASRSI